MDVYLCFGKSFPIVGRHTDLFGPVITYFADVHSSVMLVFVNGKGDGTLTVYDININTRVFEEQTVQANVADFQSNCDFLDVSASVDEYARLLSTCQACVRTKKRYNYKDIILYNVPFREPVEKNLFDTETLFDAQAVILILRACLSPEHPSIPVLRTLHSRTTMANQLYETLSPVLPCVHASRVCAASRESVSVMQPET